MSAAETGSVCQGGRSDAFTDLKAGTFLRHILTETRIRLSEDMRGDLAHVHYVRKDGQRHRGRIGWSGRLRKDDWRLESASPRQRAEAP